MKEDGSEPRVQELPRVQEHQKLKSQHETSKESVPSESRIFKHYKSSVFLLQLLSIIHLLQTLL